MFKKSFLLNLITIVGLMFAMYFLFFKSLGWITNHGAETTVPNVLNRDLRVAIEDLEKQGYEVVVDSTYDASLKAYEVVQQIPEVGQKVKVGRTIFLTVNKSVPPTVPMPNLNGLSFRSAYMILKSNLLILGDTTFRPDIADGAVLEQNWRGSIIKPGMPIPQGATIDLVLGQGLGNVEIIVPDLIGLTIPQAIEILQSQNLQYTLIADDKIIDSNAALVYYQIPNAINELKEPNYIREGDFIDFRIKQKPTEEEMEKNRKPYLEMTPEENEVNTPNFKDENSKVSQKKKEEKPAKPEPKIIRIPIKSTDKSN